MRFAKMAVMVVVSSGCAASIPRPEVPEPLRVAPDQVTVLEARARGAQVYECRASQGDPARFEWTLTGPDAELYDQAGRVIGRHYAGPTWELADGSKVVGAVKAKDLADVADQFTDKIADTLFAEFPE